MAAPGVWPSLLIFAYGSRLTQHMDVAGWNYVYFLGTLLALYFFAHDPRQHSQTPPTA